MQEKRLGDYVSQAANLSIANAIEHTIGYAGGFVFQLAAITAIGSWTAYLAATIAGSLALYIPLVMINNGLHGIGRLTKLNQDILMFAYSVGSPIVGALVLNFLFAWTMPIMAVVACAAIGGCIHLLFAATSKPPAQGNNAGNAAPAQQRRTSVPLARAVPVYPSQMGAGMFFDVNAFFDNDPFFTNAQTGRANPRANPRASSRPGDSTTVEVLDDNGNVMEQLPRVGGNNNRK